MQFQDESRLIASEYMGGLHRYEALDRKPPTPPQGGDAATSLRAQHRRTDSVLTTFSASDAPTPSAMAPGSMYYPKHQSEGIRTLDAGHFHSRRSSDASFLAASSPHPRYGLGIQDQLPVKSETPRSHAYRASDGSSVASLSTPAVVGPSHTFSTSSGAASADGIVTPPPSDKALTAERAYLNSPEEIFYMQVFVEEVGVWMDSFDKDKHFSRLIPYHSLRSPMLLNAFLACGVKHLTLVDKEYNDDRALFYYDTATTQLLRSLQNPDRNTAECATTAVVLNVYEIMSEKPAQRMNHIAGARALIRECGWNARSTGIGAACFWLNIGMEVLSCLAFNWQTAWDPDQWGVDMDFSPADAGDDEGGGVMEVGSDEGVGCEEIWVHRIFYIVGRIANFRATIPRFQEACPHDEQIRLGNRLSRWQELKRLCDSWNNSCPKTMHPFGYLYPAQTKSKSAFPNVWYVVPSRPLWNTREGTFQSNASRLIKRAAIIGRLFYHTAQCLLAQTHPMEPTRSSPSMRTVQLHHAHQVCGIVAHNKDRGVSSVAIRSLAIASSVLADPSEQDEVLEIMTRIAKESGWQLGRVTGELRRAWGREGAGRPGIVAVMEKRGAGTPAPVRAVKEEPSPAPVVEKAPAPVKVAVNPLSLGDFSLPNHPYQNWYEPPSRATGFSQPFY